MHHVHMGMYIGVRHDWHMPGECLVAGLPVEEDLALLGQDYVAWQAEVQLHRGDQVGVAPADGSLEHVLGVLVVDDLCHCGSGITAHQTQLEVRTAVPTSHRCVKDFCVKRFCTLLLTKGC